MGENEHNLLYDTAAGFAKLKDIGYGFVLGRKRKEYHIQLRFPFESFFHLAGLQHLKDIIYPSNNKERIFREILNDHLKYETIRKSQYFEEFHIEERLKYLNNLEAMLDSCEIIFFNKSKRICKIHENKGGLFV